MGKIEFVIPTWNRPNKLMGMLFNLINQTDPNWSAHIIIDGVTTDYDYVKDYFKDHSNILFSHIDGPNGDWGHTARNYGLDKVQEEWLVMTGDDNYYVPTFVEEFRKQITNDTTNFLFCDMVHNLALGGYQKIESIPIMGGVDIGNVCIRVSKIGDIRLNPKSYEGDWEFFDKYIRRHRIRPLKINKILYVHN